MRNPVAAVGVVAALTIGGCWWRPRRFNPTLAGAAADQGAFAAAYAECRQLYADGKLNSNGQLASAGGAAAAGATTAAVGGAAAAAAGGWAGVAVASATVVLLPFAAVAGAWKLAKNKKNKKERAAQQAAAGCLIERGYPVIGWVPVKDKAAVRPAAAERR